MSAVGRHTWWLISYNLLLDKFKGAFLDVRQQWHCYYKLDCTLCSCRFKGWSDDGKCNWKGIFIDYRKFVLPYFKYLMKFFIYTTKVDKTKTSKQRNNQQTKQKVNKQTNVSTNKQRQPTITKQSKNKQKCILKFQFIMEWIG